MHFVVDGHLIYFPFAKTLSFLRKRVLFDKLKSFIGIYLESELLDHGPREHLDSQNNVILCSASYIFQS